MVHGPAIALELQCNGLAYGLSFWNCNVLSDTAWSLQTENEAVSGCAFERQVLGAGLVAEVEPGKDWLISTPKYQLSIILSIQNS